MKHKKIYSQDGIGHLAIVAAIFVVIVGLLGFVGYSSYKNRATNAGTQSTLGSGGSSGANSVYLIKNFRDASTTTNGTVLKKGVLYRSPQLSNISDRQKNSLTQLLSNRGALIVDLRTVANVRAEPDRRIAGTTRTNIPMGGFHDTTPMVKDSTRRQQLAKALRVIGNNRGPVLVHCTVGKDRTGWAVAMIMYISGASDRQVYREYAKSQDAYPSHDPDWIKSGVALAKKRYGSIMGYLKKGVGLSDYEIRKIRNKFKA